METTMNRIIFSTLLICNLIFSVVHAQAIDHTFTYQGELIDNGVAANDLYDMKVQAFTTLSGVNTIGNTSVHEDGVTTGVTVSNGLFTIGNVDLGTTAFDGDEIWLEVSIKKSSDAGASYVALSPRQKMTAVPYAFNLAQNGAASVQVLTYDGTQWSPSTNLSSPWSVVNSEINFLNNVGIGITNPFVRLHVESTLGLNAIFDGGNKMYVLFQENGNERGYVGSYQDANIAGINDEDFEIGTSFGSVGNMHIVTGNNEPRMTITAAGNVGINTLSPSADLALDAASDGDVLRIKVDNSTKFYIDKNGGTGIGSWDVPPANGLLVKGETKIASTLYVSSPTSQYAPDIILQGTANSASADEGVISTDPRYAGSDMWLMSNDAVIIRLDQDDNEQGQFEIRNGTNVTVFDVQEDGSVRQNGSTIHASDKRLKKDIEEIPYGLAEIMVLEPKAYNWKDRQQENKSFGLIAQEVQPIIKEIVHTSGDKEKTLGLSYTELIPVMIKAIQEQQAIIDQQDKKIDNLVKMVEELMLLNRNQKK